MGLLVAFGVDGVVLLALLCWSLFAFGAAVLLLFAVLGWIIGGR